MSEHLTLFRIQLWGLRENVRDYEVLFYCFIMEFYKKASSRNKNFEKLCWKDLFDWMSLNIFFIFFNKYIKKIYFKPIKAIWFLEHGIIILEKYMQVNGAIIMVFQDMGLFAEG